MTLITSLDARCLEGSKRPGEGPGRGTGADETKGVLLGEGATAEVIKGRLPRVCCAGFTDVLEQKQEEVERGAEQSSRGLGQARGP